MPTVEHLTAMSSSLIAYPHYGPPWRISGFKSLGRRWKTSLTESSNANVDSAGVTFLSSRLAMGTEEVSPMVALTSDDKALVSISPNTAPYLPSGEMSLYITYPNDESWHGSMIYGNQEVESPVFPGFGHLWTAFCQTGIAAPGPFSRTGKTLTFSTVGQYNTNQGTGSLVGFEWDFNGDTQTIGATGYTGITDPIIYFRGTYFTREFPNHLTQGGPIRVRGITSDNAKTAWCNMRFNPCAIGTIQQQDNDVLSVDGTESFDPDGTVTEWIWSIGTNFTVGPTTFTYTTPTKEIPISAIPGPWRDNLTVNATLRVRDNEGLLSLPIPLSFVYYHIPSTVGLIDDPAGAIFAASQVNENVEVAHLPGGLATRKTVYVIPNAKNPGYAYNARTGKHYVSYEDRETKEQKVVASVDGGSSWQ